MQWLRPCHQVENDGDDGYGGDDGGEHASHYGDGGLLCWRSIRLRQAYLGLAFGQLCSFSLHL